MEEIWKDIPNYEGLYQVSNLGKIKSLPRKWVIKEKVLKPLTNGHGYLFVILRSNNKYKHFEIHQLLAIAFLNHIPCGLKTVVDHINHIKTDNRLVNLQLTSNRNNCSKNKTDKTSNYTGVYFNKKANKFMAQIYLNGKTKYLGLFNNEYDAHLAYQKKLLST